MRYLGIDFGLRRIGLATSEGQLASPFKVAEVRSLDDATTKMIRIIEAEKIDRVVVGIPEGKLKKLVKKFMKRLQDNGVIVVEADETLSSQKAIRHMIEENIPKKDRRINDAYSAAIILQNWLDRF